MRTIVTALAVLTLTTGAGFAQTDPTTGARPGNVIGTGQSLPLSSAASNITPGDTQDLIAPRLPEPPVSDSAPPRDFLMAARRALAENQTGVAQEALERAESRALTRSVAPPAAGMPSGQPLVQIISNALRALAAHDVGTTVALIDQAAANPEAVAQAD